MAHNKLVSRRNDNLSADCNESLFIRRGGDTPGGDASFIDLRRCVRRVQHADLFVSAEIVIGSAIVARRTEQRKRESTSDENMIFRKLFICMRASIFSIRNEVIFPRYKKRRATRRNNLLSLLISSRRARYKIKL